MDPFLGQVQIFGFNFAPRGWAFCDGQLLQVSQYQALFSLLGTTYGGDGRTTFALPDLRGRAPVHQGTGPGLSNRRMGEKGGTETNTLAVANLPAHSHAANALTAPGNSNQAAGNFWARDAGTQSATYHPGPSDTAMASGAIGQTGSGQSVNNLQPYLVIPYSIALQGTFPSRN